MTAENVALRPVMGEVETKGVISCCLSLGAATDLANISQCDMFHTFGRRDENLLSIIFFDFRTSGMRNYEGGFFEQRSFCAYQ
jgi:hypothetical protein